MAADETLPLPPLPEERTSHVYVVNSNPDFLEIIRDVLADVHLHVTVEELRPNVQVTLDNLRAARPDLLLLDVVPFHADARRLLDALNQSEDLAGLPVLLASTSASAAEQLAGEYPSLVRDVLPKPFDLDVLYTKLRKLVGATAP
jgi:CheY-like chemotaxis protein